MCLSIGIGVGRALAGVLTVVAVTSSCSTVPEAQEGQRKLAGMYVLADRRVPQGELNPNFEYASLNLMRNGEAVQVCRYKDGTKYESRGMTWSYDGEGNIRLSPLKDCSWVYGLLGQPREGPLDPPGRGASLIVEWGRRPVIVLHPDLNAFYEWQSSQE